MRKAVDSLWIMSVQNRVIGIVLSMAVLVPLAATPFDSRLRGIAALCVEGLAILLMFALLWRINWNLRRESVTNFLKSGANLPVVLFLALIGVSCLFSPVKGYSAQEFLRIGAGILVYFVATYQFRRSEHLSKLVDVVIAVTIAASIIGLYEYGSSPDKFAVGPFGDHQLFGSFLMILLPIVAVIAIAEKAMKRQLAAQVATVLAITSLLLAHSRSAWTGAAVGLTLAGALLAWTIARHGKRQSHRNALGARKHELLLPVMLILVAAGLFMVLTPQAGSILQRASTLSTLRGESAWEDRQQTWRGAINMIKARPLTGFGIGLYPYYQQGYTDGCNMRKVTGRPFLSEQAHNFYLQTAADLGVPGLALFVSILLVFWFGSLRKLPTLDHGIRRTLLVGSVAATAAFAVDAFASPSWQIGQVSIFFWLALGMGAACLRSPEKSTETEQTRTVPLLVSRPITASLALALGALLPTVAFAAAGDCYTNVAYATIIPNAASGSYPGSVTFRFTITLDNGQTYCVTLDPNTEYKTTDGKGTFSVNFDDPGNDCNDTMKYTIAEADKGKTIHLMGFYKCQGTVKDTLLLTVAP